MVSVGDKVLLPAHISGLIGSSVWTVALVNETVWLTPVLNNEVEPFLQSLDFPTGLRYKPKLSNVVPEKMEVKLDVANMYILKENWENWSKVAKYTHQAIAYPEKNVYGFSSWKTCQLNRPYKDADELIFKIATLEDPPRIFDLPEVATFLQEGKWFPISHAVHATQILIGRESVLSIEQHLSSVKFFFDEYCNEKRKFSDTEKIPYVYWDGLMSIASPNYLFQLYGVSWGFVLDQVILSKKRTATEIEGEKEGESVIKQFKHNKLAFAVSNTESIEKMKRLLNDKFGGKLDKGIVNNFGDIFNEMKVNLSNIFVSPGMLICLLTGYLGKSGVKLEHFVPKSLENIEAQHEQFKGFHENFGKDAVEAFLKLSIEPIIDYPTLLQALGNLKRFALNFYDSSIVNSINAMDLFVNNHFLNAHRTLRLSPQLMLDYCNLFFRRVGENCVSEIMMLRTLQLKDSFGSDEKFRELQLLSSVANQRIHREFIQRGNGYGAPNNNNNNGVGFGYKGQYGNSMPPFVREKLKAINGKRLCFKYLVGKCQGKMVGKCPEMPAYIHHRLENMDTATRNWLESYVNNKI